MNNLVNHMSFEEFLEELIVFIVKWTIYYAIIILALIIIGAALLPSVGSYIQSGSGNEFIKILGLSEAVNGTGLWLTSLGGTYGYF